MAMALILVAVAAWPANLPLQVVRFSRSQSLSHSVEIVDVQPIMAERGGPTGEFRARRTVIGLLNSEPRWTDSPTCPALKTALRTLQTLKMPTPAPLAPVAPPMIDGDTYTLDAITGVSGGSISISSNGSGPPAQWVGETLDALSSCWSPPAP